MPKKNIGCASIYTVIIVVAAIYFLGEGMLKNTKDSWGDLLFCFFVVAGIGYLIHKVSKKN